MFMYHVSVQNDLIHLKQYIFCDFLVDETSMMIRNMQKENSRGLDGTTPRMKIISGALNY